MTHRHPLAAWALGLAAAAILGLLYLGAHAQVVTSADPPKGIACAYNATPPTAGSSGVAMWVQCDSQGRVITSSGASTSTATHVASTALAATQVLKATPGNFYGANCTGITGGSAGYCVILNSTSAPADGAITPLDACSFAAGTQGCSIYRTVPIPYSTGITVVLTTAASPYTKTTGTDTAFISGDFQ